MATCPSASTKLRLSTALARSFTSKATGFVSFAGGVAAFFFSLSIAFAQTSPDPAPPAASLPDPLVMADGTKVTTAEQWRTERRPELLEFFANEMYGHSPGRPDKMRFKVFETDPMALGGKATRKQVTVYYNGEEDGPKMELLIYLPNAAKRPAPTILGMNFYGNPAVNADPGIKNTKNAARGTNAKQWPLETILSRGYAVATFYREEVARDNRTQGLKAGVHTLYPELQNRGDNFGTIAAWAWAFSRALDYLATDPDIDAKRVAAFGWSRLGKAALWAGATDERFALVISNESGAGGAKLFHRGVGENIARLNTAFPHWFAANFRKYIDKDKELPFDQHMIIALIAPRPVYVASAQGDSGSDPEGEFASAKAADPVYRFLGTEGLPTDKWPAVDQPVQGRIGYHVRSGGHDVTDYDWAQYLDFADKNMAANGGQK